MYREHLFIRYLIISVSRNIFLTMLHVRYFSAMLCFTLDRIPKGKESQQLLTCSYIFGDMYHENNTVNCSLSKGTDSSS